MTKLSDTQLVILTAAAQHPNRMLLPLPPRLKGGAVAKVIASLSAKGLVEEVDAKRGDPIWRETGNGHRLTLVATDAGLREIGIEVAEEANAVPARSLKSASRRKIAAAKSRSGCRFGRRPRAQAPGR